MISKLYIRLQKTGKELSSILVWASTEKKFQYQSTFSIKLNKRTGWIPEEVVPDHTLKALLDQHQELKVTGREIYFIHELI